MINAVLIDDEIDSIKVLQRLLNEYCPEVNIVGNADSVETGAQLIQTAKPEIVFLDIEMKQGNAFDLLSRLTPFNFQVIFVTAFDNYAIKAFRYSALDYLLKPVDIDDLKNAVEKAKAGMKGDNFYSQMKVLLHNIENYQVAQQRIAIPTVNGMIFIPIREILRCEAEGGYTYIYTEKGGKIFATHTIKEYEELLPSTLFYRIHNSHIVNLEKIRKYEKGRGGYVVMEDGVSLEVATRRREEFLSKFVK